MYQQGSSIMSQQEISEKLQFYVSARNLVNLGLNSPVNSFLTVYLEQPNQKKKIILKTKVYQNDLNPNYAESFIVNFVFQVKQKLTFQICNDSKPPKLIGRLQTSIGQIFGSPTKGLIKPLKNQKTEECGKIIIRCQKIQKGKRRSLTAKICAEGLPNLTWWYFFGGTSPFFRIFRKRRNDELLLYESEVINKSTNPEWKQFKISEQKLCKLNEQADLEVRVYNHSNNGNHTLIGTATFSLLKLANTTKFKIVENKNTQRGQIKFKNVKRTVKHEFGQFIQNGLQLALTTCIDFTASNGNPQNKQSLHFSSLSKKSQYEQAMSEVLDILLDYDYDKLVPCFGFGAKVNHPKMKTNNHVHHCFPINGNIDNPDIYQKAEIIKAYRTILPYLQFSGPTKFSQLLKKAKQTCKQFQNNEHKTEYMILFILTDGQIHDKLQVIDLLVSCNRLPISVIIVGIGNGQFSLMKELDDDDCQMRDSFGHKTERDLVQFVEFSKFKNNGVALAREVLEELPRQVQEYFQIMGFLPQQIKRRPSDIQQQMWLKNSSI